MVADQVIAYLLHLVQLVQCMLALLHRTCQFDGTAGDVIAPRFQLDGIDAKPRSVLRTLLNPGLLLAQQHLARATVLQRAEDLVEVGLWRYVEDETLDALVVVDGVVDGLIDVCNFEVGLQVCHIGQKEVYQPFRVALLFEECLKGVVCRSVVAHSPEGVIIENLVECHTLYISTAKIWRITEKNN